jgi:hypothetical protein
VSRIHFLQQVVQTFSLQYKHVIGFDDELLKVEQQILQSDM